MKITRDAFFTIALFGAGIYLASLTFAMFLWINQGRADFIMQHGEPFLVGVLSIAMFIEGSVRLKSLFRKDLSV